MSPTGRHGRKIHRAVFLAGPPVTAALQPSGLELCFSAVARACQGRGWSLSPCRPCRGRFRRSCFASVRVDRRRQQHAQRMTKSFLHSVREFLYQCDRFEGSSVTGLRGVLAFVTGLCVKFAWCDRSVTGFQRFVRAFAAGDRSLSHAYTACVRANFGVPSAPMRS